MEDNVQVAVSFGNRQRISHHDKDFEYDSTSSLEDIEPISISEGKNTFVVSISPLLLCTGIFLCYILSFL